MKKILYLIPFVMLACNEPVAESQLPNIVFILADDMGYGDPSSYNPQGNISTPHLDQLASEGMRFTDAHSPAAWCVPSRFGLLTGTYPFRNPRSYQDGLMSPQFPTVATILKDVGYKTAMVGKWHQGIVDEKNPPPYTDLVNGPLDNGFDYFFGIPASLDIPPYYYIQNKRMLSRLTDSIAASEGTAPAPGKRKIQGPFWREGKMTPGFQHEEVLSKLFDEADSYVRGGRQDPFFLYLALPAPHTPWLPDGDHQGRSEAGDYGDFVKQVDDHIGAFLTNLERMGLKENTIVIFSSDNGPVWYPEDEKKYQHSATGPLAGMKGDALEGGHRMPFIVRWPGKVEAGSTQDGLICFTDLLASCAELTGQSLAAGVGQDSKSFVPLLLNPQSPSARESLITQTTGKVYAIRVGDWKLIPTKGSGGFWDGYDPEYAASNPFEGRLYNLKDDLSETQNLYGEMPDKVSSLKNTLLKEMAVGKE
ncbi:MAG: arylsulfatase [Bacteroidia bacterium]